MEANPNLDIALVGDEKQNEINIYMGGRNEYIAKGYSFGPFIRDFWQIEYCSRGGFNLYCNNKCFEIKDGDLSVIAPNVVALKEFTAEATSTEYLGIKGVRLARYFKILGISSENILFPHKLTPRCIEYFNACRDSLEIRESLTIKNLGDEHIVDFIPNEGYSDALSLEAGLRQTAQFSLFLAELMRIRADNENMHTNKSVQQEYIDTALRYIAANYHLNISVDSIANYIGIDRSYLFRLFREEFGMSVRDYIIRVRMRAACEFLRQPNIQVKAVAASVGYEQFNFSKTFRRVIGMSPMEYREKYKRQ